MPASAETDSPKGEGKKQPSNLLLRVLSALVALPLIMALLYLGPAWGFYLLVLPAAMLGAFELFAMTHPGDRVSQVIGLLLSAVVSLSLYFFGSDHRVLVTVLVSVAVMGPVLTLVRLGDMKTAALRALALSAGPFYVAAPLTLIALMRRDAGPEGPGFVVLSLALAWAADTGGYFGGRFFGRHKLYEAVSPKKTVEGAIGGLLGAVLGAVVVHFVTLRQSPLSHLLPLAVVGGALGQAGDLGESLIKRSVGVKDSGAIVPGHGGILDRVDALLLTGTAVFLYTLWR
jgi:phosphatidate cytidylyltransferase